MPKATSLTPEALTPQQTTPLAATKQRGQKDAPKKTIKPIQFRPSEEQAWEIKTAASAEHMNITPTGKPPPLAVRLEKALPFRR